MRNSIMGPDILPVRVIVYVSAKDIDQGVKHKQNACPIALAIKRRVKAENVKIDGTSVILFKVDGQYKTGYLPINVTKFIRGFDAGNYMHPFRFELNYCERVYFD